MSSSRLESRIATLRSSVRRLLALYGLSWLVGLILPLIIVAGLADWLIHLDAMVRLLALAGLLGFGGWLTFKYILLPLFVRFGDLEIALRIEEHWPGLNDRLASTVQFLNLGSDDDRFGSSTLREATIRQTLEETEGIDFRQAVEPMPVYRAAGLAAGAVAIGLAFLMTSPDLSRIALRRLFLPYGADRWPQRTHLSLGPETARKLARGEPFTLAVAVGKGEHVPASARATYRSDDGEVIQETLRVVEGGGFRGRIDAVERSFSFSVAAGDDSTSLRNIAVAVVPPPSLTQLNIRLVSPAYTELLPQTLAPGNTQVRALEGTRIELEGRTNKTIKQAVLHLGDKLGKEPVSIDARTSRLSTSLLVAESAPFWFDLMDTEGFRNREATRYELRVVRDEAPRVVIDEPPNDRDVPAQATVPIMFTVDDDYGIQSARLIYRVASGGSEPTQTIALPLWDAKGQAAGQPVKHQEVRYDWDLGPMKLTPGSIITFHAEARDFDNLKGPNIGRSRELRLRVMSEEEIARQLDDQRREIREETARILTMQKQAQAPVENALRTLSKTDRLDPNDRDELKNAEMIQRQVGNRISNKTDGLDQKVRRFLDDLRNFKLPNPDARKQMEEIQAGVERIREKHLEPAEQGLTHAAKNADEAEASRPEPRAQSDPSARTENEPARAAKSAPDSAKSKGRESLASRAQEPKSSQAGRSESKKGEPNKGDSSKGESSKGESSKGESSKGESSKGESSKGESSKGESRPEPSTPKDRFLQAARDSLGESKENQKAIADELQRMLDGLSEFETYRGVVKDAQNLLKEQEQSIKQTAEAANKDDLMGKGQDALSPEQKADLANLGARQSNVARGLQNLQERMEEMAKRVDEQDPLAAAALKEAANESRKKGTTAKMGEAADRLEKNQMGEARAAQDQARRDLKDLVDSIQDRRERELARLVKELKNAEEELKKLRERQTENLKKTREAKKNPNAKQRGEQLQKLAKEQQEIQKSLDRQLKRLAKLNAEGAVRAGSRASGKMAKAEGELDQDQGDQAGEDQEEALADLEDAEDQVKQNRRELEEQLAMEQLSKMGDQLKSLTERQEGIVTRTVEYEKLRTQNPGSRFTMAQRTGVRDLGRVQGEIKDETGELIEKLEGAPVFALTLRRASDGMDQAAQRLTTMKTDEETQHAARSAAKRFNQLIDALKADKAKAGNGGGGGGGGEGGGGGGGGDGIPPEAQVKMLKALQEEINERTEFFDELKRRNKPITPSQLEEIDRLHNDQGTLADLTRDLTRPKKDDGED